MLTAPTSPQHTPGGYPRQADPMARLGARLLSEVSAEPAPPALLTRYDPEGPNVLFGTGGCGKGCVASADVVALARLGYRILIVDYESHPGEWARRIDGLGGTEARAAVLYVAPSGPDWHGRRGALWAHADELLELADAFGATFLVVDSAVPACGAVDPLSPEAAGQYFSGLERVGRPSLTLAHVTKAGDLRMPFGSGYWHHLARATWSLSREGESLLLENRKANNYPHLGRFAVALGWYDGALGSVTLRPYNLVLADRIAELLVDGPMSAPRIADELSADGEPVKAESVRRALNRSREAFTRRGNEWEIRS